MSDEGERVELTDWEQAAASALASAGLPMWEYKGRAAVYTQGHRGILDLDLDFPSAYLKGPAIECYVWKTAVADGTRVHAYADIDGRRFHLEWRRVEGQVQNQPDHEEGPCSRSGCRPCQAAEHVAAMCRV